MFCVDSFYDFQDDGTRKRVPYREIELFRSAQALFKRALREESSAAKVSRRSLVYHPFTTAYHRCEIIQPAADDIRLAAMIYTLRVMIYRCFRTG